MSEHWLFDNFVLQYLALRPTDPCLCGSGRPFSKCHMLSGQRSSVSTWDIRERLLKLYKTKRCYFADSTCSSVYTASHSISRKHLAVIAESGHVFRYMPPMNPERWESMTDSTAEPDSVGINDASTFYGFCSQHDDQLFQPFEKSSLSLGRQQSTLLLYRALCRELYVKSEVVRMVPVSKQIVESKVDAGYKQVLNAYLVQNYLGQFRALQDLMRDYEQVSADIRRSAWAEYSCLTFVLDEELPVACAGYVNPPFDLEGGLFQDYNDLSRNTVSFGFNIFSQDGRGSANFCWRTDTPFDRFFEPLDRISESRISDYLVQMVFAFSENHALSPKWWNGLSLIQKRRLKKIFFPDIVNPEIGFNPAILFRYLGFSKARIIEIKRER